MPRTLLPFRPTTGVTTYDRLTFSRLTPVAGALQTRDTGVAVEQVTSSAVETYSPGGPRLAIWSARAPRQLRLRGLSKGGFDGEVRRGAAMVIAPHTPTWWEAPTGSPGGIVVSIEPSRIESIMQEAAFSSMPEWSPLENVQNRTMWRLCSLIEDEVADPVGHDRFFLASII